MFVLKTKLTQLCAKKHLICYSFFLENNFSFCLALDQVRKQQMEVKQILHELDKRHKELDFVIERAKNATIDPTQENDTEDESETTMYCITCGHEIHSRTAIKHMEKCFNKYESQASFGSIFKTRIEGEILLCFSAKFEDKIHYFFVVVKIKQQN